MVGQSDAALLRRRRRFFVVSSFFSGSFAAGGMLIGVFDGDPLGYLVGASFGACAVFWASHLLIPPELLLNWPATHFVWIAPSEPAVQPPSRGCSLREEPPTPRPTASMNGVLVGISTAHRNGLCIVARRTFVGR